MIHIDTTPGNINKETQGIILYFINKLDGVLGKTRLQKLLFLTDLMATKKFETKLTKIDFKRYKHGPYSPQLDVYTEDLIKNDYIEEKEFSFAKDTSKKYVRYYIKKNVAIKQYLLKKIGPDKVILLDEIINSYGNMSLQNLLDIVYSLNIVKNTKMDELLNIGKDVEDENNEEIDF